MRADGDVRAACERLIQEWYANAPLSLTNEREQGTGVAVIVLLTLLMLLVGTTFAGHDWNTGSMSNQLLFEPRRARVWLAKAVAVLLVTGVVSRWCWSPTGPACGRWPARGTSSSRRRPPRRRTSRRSLGTIFAALAGVVGYALTMLFRSTVATLGVLFAIAFVGAILAGALGLARYERVMPWGNFAAYTVGSYTYYPSQSACFDDDGQARSTSRVREAHRPVGRLDLLRRWSSSA